MLLFFSLTWLDFDFGKNMEWKKSDFPFLVFIKTLNISTETQRMVIKSKKFICFILFNFFMKYKHFHSLPHPTPIYNLKKSSLKDISLLNITLFYSPR